MLGHPRVLLESFAREDFPSYRACTHLRDRVRLLAMIHVPQGKETYATIAGMLQVFVHTLITWINRYRHKGLWEAPHTGKTPGARDSMRDVHGVHLDAQNRIILGLYARQTPALGSTNSRRVQKIPKLKQQVFESAFAFGSVCPEKGCAEAVVMPSVNHRSDEQAS